jgi:hypothetical protein
MNHFGRPHRGLGVSRLHIYAVLLLVVKSNSWAELLEPLSDHRNTHSGKGVRW